ncbi:MAG: hypothetical protein QG604_565 [Candidatus Dependentiae bacterium]|nr:hypothetical protein [Candidatus Dependentiae bacterium]
MIDEIFKKTRERWQLMLGFVLLSVFTSVISLKCVHKSAEPQEFFPAMKAQKPVTR